MRLVLAALLLVAGCGDDVLLPATDGGADLSAVTPVDMTALGCEGFGHTWRCAPVGLVCSFATDAEPYYRCFCDGHDGGTWSCGFCRVFDGSIQPAGRSFDFPNCTAVDDGCRQSWGEDTYTCRCLPDGRGRCCPDSPGSHCFDVDGG
jgi:hypothetical protein